MHLGPKKKMELDDRFEEGATHQSKWHLIFYNIQLIPFFLSFVVWVAVFLYYSGENSTPSSRYMDNFDPTIGTVVGFSRCDGYQTDVYHRQHNDLSRHTFIDSLLADDRRICRSFCYCCI